MTSQTWIELFGVLIGGSGGATLISKLTRLAVAVELLVKSNETIVGKVDNHEIRLTKGGL